MNFNFNNKAAPAFGAPTAAVTATSAAPASTATGFTFGGAAQPTSFSFTTPTANPITSSIFGASAAPNFSFGSPQTTQSNMFGGLSSIPQATTQSTPGFGFSAQPVQPVQPVQPAQPAQNASSFTGFGSPSATSAAPALAFGSKPAGASPGWPSFAATSPSTVASLNFGQGATTTTPAAGLNTNFAFGSGGSLQQPAGTSSITGLNFGQIPTSSAVSTPTPGFGFGQQTSAAAPVLQPSATKPALSFGAPNTSIAANINLVPASTAPLSFGNTGASPSSMFSFGNTNIANTAAVAANTVTPAAPSFGLGTSNTSTPSMFGKPATAVSAPAPAPAAIAPTSGFSFGTPQQQIAPVSQTTGFSFGGATSAPPAFGAIPTSTPASSAAQISVIKPTQSVSFTTTPQTKPAEFSFGNSTAPATTPSSTASLPTSGLTGFQFPAQAAPVSNLSTLSTAVSTPPSNLQPKTLTSGLSVGTALPAATTSIPATSTLPVSFAASTAASSLVTGFQLPNTSAVSTSTSAVTTLATTAVSSAASTLPTPVTSMNFLQLENAINKWNFELEEQEKVFLNQATQVNAWDKLLIANGEKIVALNESLQSVRTEQQSLDHELDFVSGQQRELEELLVPLERELSNVIITDPEREQTYRLADTIDTQLKQMSEDLKEIIEHLNESNRREDNNDPIVQIGRILNAHMSSMQWIDSSIAQISVKLDQLSNMHNMLKRHNKRSFNLTYK